jgi:anti-sigma factor RsiW
MAPQNHVSVDLMERYVKGTTDASEQKKITEHLAGCQDCRDRVMAIERFLGLRKKIGRRD